LDTIEKDYDEPLEAVYESLHESGRIFVDSNAPKIKKYFIFWCLFIILSALCIVGWISCDLIHETVGKRIQRAGSIIPLFALFGEFMFLIKLNKLVSVIHPAELTCEIYLSRKFKKLKHISLYSTTFFIFLGAVLSGYGDLLYKA